MNKPKTGCGADVPCISLLAERPSNGPLLPRPETVRMAAHILNHYAKDSRKDHICLARRLEKWAHGFTANTERTFAPDNKQNDTTFLRWAEDALRDISERCEHSGTNERCRDEVAKISSNYWHLKSNKP